MTTPRGRPTTTIPSANGATGLFKRQTSGSIVCPGCGRLVGVQDERCFNCGRVRPGLWGFAPLINKAIGEVVFVDVVLYGCAAMFVLTLLSEPSAIGGGGLFSMLSPGQRPLFLFGASGALPVFTFGRWWTVLSASWLHGGLLHIGMNMMWMRQLLPAVEQFYGTGRLIIIYTVSGAAGFTLTTLFGAINLPWPLTGAGFTVGASAPLFGLFGALVVYSQSSGQSQLGRQVWQWVIMFTFIGLLIPIVDNWAHLGGFAGGYAASKVLDPLKIESSRHLLVAGACLALTLLSLIASVLHGIPLFTG